MAAKALQRDMLYRSGLIVPRLRGSDHGAADQFAPEDLDAFLDRLLDGAKPVKVAEVGQVSIPEAARLAFCMSEEVVRLILDGKLARKWRLTAERGYMSVLVDVEEVRALVRGPDHGGLTGIEIKDRLSTTAQGRGRPHQARPPEDRSPSSIRSTDARPSSCLPKKSNGSRANTSRCSRWRSSRDGIFGR